jgi:hypothetical protein
MRLPVSGLDVSFRLPDGHDDLAILEAGGDTSTGNAAGARSSEAQAAILERALDALRRLARLVPSKDASPNVATTTVAPTHSATAPDAAPLESSWPSLTVTDFEASLLGLRRFLFGDTVRSVVRCACSERMEIEFSIAHLLREAHPRTPHRAHRSATRPDWFDLHSRQNQTDAPLAFRLPTVTDQLLALRSPNPYGLLEQRCIESSRPDSRAIASAERAMEAMSPAISRPIDGTCAACGATLNPQLHVPSLVLDELRASAAGVHREIHVIAAAYHWDESAILAMPQLRRQAYTDTIRQAGAR